MSKTHIVKQGEHLSGIALAYGFTDFHTIWDDGGNAGLKAIRDPHVLFPGDELFIPDHDPKTEPGATGKVHVFELDEPALFLRLKILDLDNRPVKGADGKLGLDGQTDPVTTDAAGILIHDLDPLTMQGELRMNKRLRKTKKTDPDTFETLKYDLLIGRLNPEKKLSGQQARLNNLGYFAGFTLNDLEQLLWAAEEFECDQINLSQARVTETPKLVGVALVDQKDGKELGDPDHETGIQGDKIPSRLKKNHGC